MSFIFLLLLSFQATANEQIDSLMSEKDHISDEILERIEDEDKRWKTSIEKKREYWKYVFFQTHHDLIFKSLALSKWISTFDSNKMPHKEIEDAAVYSHYEFLQAKDDGDEIALERWSWMASMIENSISNLEESKERRELIKILKIRIDPRVHHLYF